MKNQNTRGKDNRGDGRGSRVPLPRAALLLRLPLGLGFGSFGGLYRSGDLGETWDRLPAHGLASDRIWSLAVDPLGGERILASASTGGLHLFRPQEAPQPRVGSAP